MNHGTATLMVLACLLAACGKENGDLPSVGTLERDRIELVADSNEAIVDILVREGDQVAAHDVLLLQDSSLQAAKLAGARAERDAALARLREAEAGPRLQEIEQGSKRLQAAESAIAAAESLIRSARAELEREKSLVKQHYASKNLVDILQGRYDEAMARRDEAIAHRQEAQAALDQLYEGYRSEVIDEARSRYAAASARVSELEINFERTRVRASVPGTIEALPYEIGERPAPGHTVVAMLGNTRIYARVHVPEPLRTRLKVGDTASLRIDGYADPFRGRLHWISAAAVFTPYFALTQQDRSQLSYTAEVDLLDVNINSLPVGVPVEVYFPGLQP